MGRKPVAPGALPFQSRPKEGFVFLDIMPTHPDAVIPEYAYPGDAGMDLTTVEHVILGPGEAADLSVGLRIALPVGWYGRITGRSSTMRRRNLLINEGIIDNGYHGDLFVYVRNLNGRDAAIEPGARLAQLILAPIGRAEIRVVGDMPESARGTQGFGSSGMGGPL